MEFNVMAVIKQAVDFERQYTTFAEWEETVDKGLAIHSRALAALYRARAEYLKAEYAEELKARGDGELLEL